MAAYSGCTRGAPPRKGPWARRCWARRWPRRVALPPPGLPWAMAPFATATASRRSALSFPGTRAPCTCCAEEPSASSRAERIRRRFGAVCCPTTAAGPTPNWHWPRRRLRERADERALDDRTADLALAGGRDPPAQLPGPATGDRDRAAGLPDALVAGDVRARALQAVRHLPRRRRGRVGWWVT